MKTLIRPTTFFLAALASAQFATGATIVAENFGGDGTGDLNGTTADTFAAGITTAGGSNTWVASTNFKDNGFMGTAGNVSAYLNLGSYINDSRGAANGKFTLSVTMPQPTAASWAGFTFFESNTPSTAAQFTNAGALGMGTLIYRSGATNNLSAFAGPGSTAPGNGVGSITVTGTHTLSMVLDLTPAGGYDGTANFGTISFFDGATQIGTSFTHTALRSFGAIGLTTAGSPTIPATTFSNFSLTQVPEPSAALLGGVGLLALLRRRRN